VEEREQEEFRIVDKRKAKGEQAAPSTQPEASSPAEGPSAEPATAEVEEREPAQPSKAYALLSWIVGLLYQQAWINMGLAPDPATGQVTRDMGQARVAIDCAEFIVKQLEGHVQAQQLRELRTLVSNLQVNFVTHSG